MRTVYIFADESGNFDFRNPSTGASRYFAVGTVMLFDEEPRRLRADVHELRDELAWDGLGLDSGFHATTDRQKVRDGMFNILKNHPIRVDVTLLEKSKAQPQVRETDERFYQHAWFYHLRNLVQRHLSDTDRLMLCAAELGTKKRRTAFRSALLNVCQQCAFHISHQVAFWPYASEPCLWVADYSLWAVVRHWERGDDRSLDLIRPKVHSQYDLFGPGATHYY